MDKKTTVRPGRTVKGKRIVRIPVSGLKVGMYICELDRPWLETPFILQGFHIRNTAEIDEVAKYCHFVNVEISEDTWSPAEERTVQSPRLQRTQTYTNTVSGKEEFYVAQTAHQQARSITKSFLDEVRFGRDIDVKAVKTTVSECVRSVMRNPDAMLWMGKVRKQDEYTAEHCLNVGLLAIAFGRHLGAQEEDLNKLGMAGMLHDVGKMRTPAELLNKQGLLTPAELEALKAHAEQGRDILMGYKNIYHGVVDVAYSHHENVDGSGYPRKIKAGGITDFTRIISLCDVYDSITSDRVYKKGASSLNATRIILDHAGTKFDAKLAKEFIDFIGLYPPGSVVELHNGEAGIVISTNHRHRHLPKVMILRDAEKKPCTERIVNLERLAGAGIDDANQLIRNVLPNGSFGIRLEEYIEKGLMLD
jgi:putative nucleotidyltransferase with HDIG domain